jgi:hypothetical protein
MTTAAAGAARTHQYHSRDTDTLRPCSFGRPGKRDENRRRDNALKLKCICRNTLMEVQFTPTSRIIAVDDTGFQHHGSPGPPACDAVGGTTIPELISAAAEAKRNKASRHHPTPWSGGIALDLTNVPQNNIKFVANVAALSYAFARSVNQVPGASSNNSVYLAIAQANETDDRFDTVIAS